MKVKEPTSQRCSARDKVFDDGTTVGYAIWYPQMGGYVGHAVVLIERPLSKYPVGFGPGSCFDVLVWHDGDFPFREGLQNPCELHHSHPDQFIEFGKKLPS